MLKCLDKTIFSKIVLFFSQKLYTFVPLHVIIIYIINTEVIQNGKININDSGFLMYINFVVSNNKRLQIKPKKLYTYK